jgi:drug/metabolite transporter (DMT)-like permease
LTHLIVDLKCKSINTFTAYHKNIHLIYLILCILINSFIGVIFKLFGKYEVNNLQAIIVNYLVCALCGLVMLGEYNFIEVFVQQSWTPIAFGLGLCFIIVFSAYAGSVQHSGVGLATIFQKLSLIAPVIVALSFYQESLTVYKVLGLILSLFALYLLSINKSESGIKNKMAFGLRGLLIVFFGSCIIDVVLFLVEVESLADGADIAFVSALFFYAMILGLAYVIVFKRELLKIEMKSLIAGLALGIPNFFSIYLLLKVLSIGWEGSVVFPANNVGVLSLAALFGVVFFKEEVTSRKLLGFTSALVAIILLSFSS